MRLFASRHRGSINLTIPSFFTIDTRCLSLFPGKEPVTRRIIREMPFSMEEELINVRGAGRIIPAENFHDGIWLFDHPNDKKIISALLVQMFFLDRIDERMHGCCGFVAHYRNYEVFNGEGRIGTVSDIVTPQLPPLTVWN